MCCNKFVDSTNPQHGFLCNKQCKYIEIGTNVRTIQTCVEPASPEHSIYPYCDDNFEKDFYGKARCKVDMCNLCCVGLETKEKSLITDDALGACYQKCIKSKIF